ncbi:GDCCVxC domain-containing (seleno)protein [Polynucleobacter sp. AP-Ainpum-60-G11]|uniref:GDCCVxC domain-containing (seleno)protein n=1 Tax=Polynucleobacter sp. AP-Ainpum-60-G11 TaxID=2576926 RepID=UPI0027385931|nr:GDCCVxC domain-containing (seleno)protein [Polynucleobacter sp. AP-Ainpum-60-G11]
MNSKNNEFHSTITCPFCLQSETLGIPVGGSQHLYRCRACNAILRPKSGDCCIFCSFGNIDCSSSEQNLAA